MYNGFRLGGRLFYLALFLYILPFSGDVVAEIVWPTFEWNRDESLNTAETVYREVIEDRLELGLRISRFKMRTTRRPEDENRELTFLGYINRLEPLQSSSPRLSIGYHINRYLTVEFTHDEVAARTWNFNNELSDGVVRMSGPIFSVITKYPIKERFIPYAGFGYAPWKARFDHDAWWTLGWSSPEHYEAAGSPSISQSGRRRVIEVDDDSSMVISGGLEVRAARHLLIDVRVSLFSLSSDARFYQVWNDARDLSRTGNFNLSHTRYSMGMRMIF